MTEASKQPSDNNKPSWFHGTTRQQEAEDEEREAVLVAD